MPVYTANMHGKKGLQSKHRFDACRPIATKEKIMIVRRRTWLYRLAGQPFAQSISFAQPVTAAMVRNVLRRSVGQPQDLWGRNSDDLPTQLK
jgi:hypothetical protein